MQREIDEIDAILDGLVLGDQKRPLFIPRDFGIPADVVALVSLWQQRIRPILDGLRCCAGERAPTTTGSVSIRSSGTSVSRINSTVLKMEVSYGKSIDVLRNLQILLIVLAVIGTIVFARFSSTS